VARSGEWLGQAVRPDTDQPKDQGLARERRLLTRVRLLVK